jgi:ribosome-binding factor A
MQGIDRVRRVSELVRRQVSQFIVHELADEDLGIVSVTAVDMKRRLSLVGGHDSYQQQ